MVNLVFDGRRETKEKEGKYLIGLLNGYIYETDTIKEMVAVICGMEYVDCEGADTEWIMRIEAARTLAMMVMMQEEMEAGFPELEEDSVIIWDVRQGRIPLSYTEEPDPPAIDAVKIHIENDDTFLHSLALIRFIAVFEKMDGEYVRWKQSECEEKLRKALIPFEEAAKK